MKIHKLFHLLALLALVACAPALGPSVSTSTAGRASATAVAIYPGAVANSATATASPAIISTTPPTRTSAPSSTPTITSTPIPSGHPWGHQTKTVGCQAAGALPDPACTPGDIFPNITATQVCVFGYSSSVRSVPASEKDAVYAEYGITSHSTGQYEVDHFVSLELGGSNDISNLWPEPANPTPGFHQKDTVENYLHDQVCKAAMTLADAQVGIATNWLAVYASTTGGALPPAASPTRVRVTFTPAPAEPTATLVQQITPTDTQAAAPTDTQVTAAPTDTEVPVVAPSDTPVPPPAATDTQAAARVRVGALCNDGSSSNAIGSGACSHHKGVQCWKYNDGTCTNP